MYRKLLVLFIKKKKKIHLIYLLKKKNIKYLNYI